VAIRISDPPEPLSLDSFRLDKDCLVVESDTSRLLSRELERYCRGEINGRSFLIAGHRGAGKTTMVSYAFLQAWKAREERPEGVRPLLVQLHGPSLLPPPPPAAEAPAGESGGVGAQAEHVGEAAAAAAGNAAPPAPAKPSPVAGQLSERTEQEEETKRALQQMVLGLHRAVTREVAASYRKRVNAREHARERRPLELREAAAQMEAELFECPTPARLREFWNLGGFMERGVLFPPDAANVRQDQGLRELLAVAGVCESYCRISGTLKFEANRKAEDVHDMQVVTTREAKGQEIFGPAVALLTGGLAGTAAIVKDSPSDALGATAVGLFAALAAGMVVKATTTRSRKRTMTRDYSFLADLSLATLDRALPMLIERLLAAGLAPVFVVDELDKVEDLPERIFGMVRHLKKLVSENAFFCFLTDRGYFESVARKNAGQAFPVESTYYTHRLFVVFRHEDMHRFLHSLLQRPDTMEVPPPAHENGAAPVEAALAGDEEGMHEDLNDWRVLPLLLLHRSQLHTLEMWRQIAAWRGDDGSIALGRGVVRTRPMYRLEIAMQAAIEIILGRSPLKERLEREPEFRRLAHDALFHPSRQWLREPEADLDLADGDAADQFGSALEKRTGAVEKPKRATGQRRGAEDEEPREPLKLISADDRRFLLQAVRELAVLLSSGDGLAAAVETEWTGYGVDATENELTRRTISEALPRSGPPLLERVGKGFLFRWNYTTTGLQRTPPAHAPNFVDAAPAPEAWMRDADLIETIENFLAGL
jgi:hypothetical protein